MERTLSPEEKIRKAEEIYARRRNDYTSRNITKVSVSEEKNNYTLFKKMILQIIICLVIYFIFYLIQNSNYVFSEDVINKTKEILSYDINIQEMCNQVINGFDQWSKSIVPNTERQTNKIQNNIENNTINNNTIVNEIQQNAMGGAELENPVLENVTIAQDTEQSNDTSDKPQSDVDYIKTNFSIIKPINGIVSSEFGQRESTNPIVSKNHTGIDIAANAGTVIKAAMEGTVTVSSTVGDYGYHIKIVNNDVSTLYAHCSKLYVNLGDHVEQGQEIAEVGSTGKSTAPHLHFEIIRGSAYINPRNILEF